MLNNMKKLSKNQTGFTLVEALLIILILAVLGGVSYMVYHNHHKAKTNSTDSTTTTSSSSNSTKAATNSNPYAGWKTYNGNNVSFQYPSSWTVGTNANPAVGVSVTSPIFTSSTAGVDSNSYGSKISMLAQIGTVSSTDYCAGSTCQVTAVVPLRNSQLSGDELAIVDQTVSGSSDTTFVVTNGSTKVGDTSVTEVGASGQYVSGQAEYNSPTLESTVTASVSNVTTLKTNTYFTNLVLLINSMKFN